MLTESEACVALNLTDRIGCVAAESARAKCGSFSAAWERLENKTSRTGGEVDVWREYALAEKFGVKIVTMVDDDYPQMLKNSPGRPLVLYVKGSVEALSMKSIAVVGTRRPTEYGISQGERFGYDLAKAGWCVVSGLALGIDAAAHRGALAAGGKTVGVLGGALDCFYPECNRELAREIAEKGGAVVSQFPFGRNPDTQTFPIRNHVVAALALGTIAVEAPLKSGTLITAGIAGDLGRVVMAVPGRVDSPASAGCLSLLRDGASLVRGSRDVAEALGASVSAEAGDETPPRASVLPPVTLEEAMVMREVAEEPVSIDELVRLTGLPVARVNTLCMTLRVKDRLRFLPGNRVAIPRSI